MCKGYTITFSTCKHIGRVVEHRCANAARLRTDHCDILVTSREGNRRQEGSCTDCLTRAATGSGLKQIRNASEVVLDERTRSSSGPSSLSLTPTPPPRNGPGVRGRPKRMEERDDGKADEQGGQSSSSTRTARARGLAETDDIRGRARIALSRDIEASYRNLLLSGGESSSSARIARAHVPAESDETQGTVTIALGPDIETPHRNKALHGGGRRREEVPESEGEPWSEDDEDSCCSAIESVDGDSADFGRWMRSQSVIDAGRRRQ